MENRHKTKLSLLITTNENKQKTKVAGQLILNQVKMKIYLVHWTPSILIF